MRPWLVPFLLVACHAPPSGLKPGVVLQYGVGHMSESVSFEVKADGDVTFDQTGALVRHVRAKASPAEIAALDRTLREHGFCSLRSHRSVGVPDEARPSIRVHLEDLDCTVQLWDGEWRDDEDAHACLQAVETFGSTLADRGVPK